MKIYRYTCYNMNWGTKVDNIMAYIVADNALDSENKVRKLITRERYIMVSMEPVSNVVRRYKYLEVND